MLEQQLEQAPNLSARKLFAWLQEEYPDTFSDGQLRTLQRRVKTWRLAQIDTP
jgi:predicted nucleotidyltransferase